MSEFILWSCLCFIMGLGTMHQIHSNRWFFAKEREKDARYKAKAQKKLWDSNFEESEKLFEKGADGCKN